MAPGMCPEAYSSFVRTSTIIRFLSSLIIRSICFDEKNMSIPIRAFKIVPIFRKQSGLSKSSNTVLCGFSVFFLYSAAKSPKFRYGFEIQIVPVIFNKNALYFYITLAILGVTVIMTTSALALPVTFSSRILIFP